MRGAIVEVVVEQHNPGWAGKFDRESQLVARALHPTVVAIHHIGSTAIPRIYAKPIIDMLVEVTSVDEVDVRNVAMASLGYESMGEFGIAGRPRLPSRRGTTLTHWRSCIRTSSAPN